MPAGKAIKLTVKNLDASAEEFESKPLKFEKVIAGKATAVIRLKPLTKGSYNFFGEYHENSAQGAADRRIRRARCWLRSSSSSARCWRPA